jgi:trans-2,3-dihydro-3-hydroxyanthranilate isomerase
MSATQPTPTNQSDLLLWIAGGAIAAVGIAWLTIMVVTLADAAELSSLARDPDGIAALGITGLNVVAPSREGWRSRMFWEHGEDPATGSAAGPIACHLARHGRVGWGEEIVIAQGVEMGRPSTLHARAEGGDGLIDAVEVGGAAVVVARGEFRF